MIDSGTITLVASTAAVIITGLLTNFFTRKSAREANDTDRFAQLVEGQGKRITALEAQLADLESRDKQREVQLRQIKLAVQKWFKQLWSAWDHTNPMPLPTPEDQELLELIVPRMR